MDTKVEKKQSKIKIILLSFVGLAILGFLGFYFFNEKKTFNVKKDDLLIEEVSYGKFEDMLMITAQTQSLHSSLINVLEGGMVKEIFAEDGQMVNKGEPLARVYNPNTEFNYLNQETGIMQQINQMRSSLLDLKNQEFNQNKELLQSQNDYNLALQTYNLQKRLYEAEIGKKSEYELAQQNLAYQIKRKEISEKGFLSEKNSRNQQILAINNSIQQMQKSLNILKTNKNNFLIISPVSGRLSSFGLSLGQNLSSGENIGKVDVMHGYKLIAKVDEYYINKLQVGTKGSLDDNSKTYQVIVSKILPEVKEGQFSVELNFAEQEKPTNLKIGMTFGVKLKLSEDTQSMMIPKGNFYKDTNGKWIFVVHNNKAEKRNIVLGRENPLYFEVISGLNKGDKVIVSDYKDYKKFEILDIKK